MDTGGIKASNKEGMSNVPAKNDLLYILLACCKAPRSGTLLAPFDPVGRAK